MWTRARAVVAACPVSLLTMALAGAVLKPGPGRMPSSWDEAVTAASAQCSLPHLWHLLPHTAAPLGLYCLGRQVALLRGVLLAIRLQFEFYGSEAPPYGATVVAAALDVPHGDAVLFDPASYRVGFGYYAGRDPVSDAKSAPLCSLYGGPASGDAVPAALSVACRVRLLTRVRGGAVPFGCHRGWSPIFGVASLDLLLR